MELWNRMTEFLLRFIDEYDDQAIFLLLFMEESGIPLPTPGDMYMVLGGVRVAQGKMTLPWVLFLLEMASVLGASVLYWAAARGGRPLLYRYGRYIGMDRAKLDRAEAALTKHGPLAVIFGRLIPGLRMPTVIAAGVFGVPYWQFLPAVAVGALPYNAVFVVLGMWLGPQAIEVLAAPRFSMRLIVSSVIFLGLGAFLVLMYRRAARVRLLEREPAPEVRRIETSMLAGFLATVEMGMGVNVLLYLLAALELRVPERALISFFERASEQFAEGSSLRLVALILTVLVVGGLLWGIVYSHLAIPLLRMKAWQRGILFSMLPLAASTLVLMPLLGAGPLGLGLGVGLLPLAGEVLRNLLFGLGLATSYSLLRAARQRPVRAAALGVGEVAGEAL